MNATEVTEATANGLPPFRVQITGRLDTLADALATANRAAIAHNTELRRLRHTLVFSVIFLTVLYWKVGK